jgi:hypothetical protein
MKEMSKLLGVVVVSIGLWVSTATLADGFHGRSFGRSREGFFGGGGYRGGYCGGYHYNWGYPWAFSFSYYATPYYYYPYDYYYPPPVYYSPPPVVYSSPPAMTYGSPSSPPAVDDSQQPTVDRPLQPSAAGQSSPPPSPVVERPQPVQRANQAQPVGVADIKALVKAGISDEVILSHLRNSQAVYHLTTAEIIDLKNNGVSEKVMDFMINTPTAYRSARPPLPPSPAH